MNYYETYGYSALAKEYRDGLCEKYEPLLKYIKEQAKHTKTIKLPENITKEELETLDALFIPHDGKYVNINIRALNSKQRTQLVKETKATLPWDE